MSYAKKFLNSKGMDCTIQRPTPFQTKVSIKRSTNSVYNVGVREAFFEGLIPIESNLISGEIVSIKNDNYIVQTVNYDLASKELEFYCAKCNVIVQHKRYTETIDENLNVVMAWETINADIPAYGEVITYRMIQQDPGLLEGTKYTLQVPKSLGVELLDRFVFNGEKYQVTSIDSLGLVGVIRCQLKIDLRAD
ncbi:MAG TPA: hypothetical protein GYA03_02190 [Tissierellia bacterium]|nr:hypothetical protein [Tissierellia bacterium]